ncbi:methylmalonyl-CoA mutase [miscellaneous Crenarchaeota group-15 archaeon DG-45]|uniref:Methylmalonyl-CoA mutase n=1 Tax=miscellaneous Crenarchaeota group-15 archaeon DG-45 TaxID=1685127 RepID=A0A0M0BR33_9ARCH|nr:MAG: methylmalonyl-CoA mutase [miscellaneous Crenarchaeota group-15 archaeon DG-45]
MFDKLRLKEVIEEEERWDKTAVPRWLEAHPERKSEFLTSSGTPVKRLYTPGDVEGLDYLRDLGFPGEFPFTRGLHATMHRGRLWTMRQFAGFGTVEQTNERFKYLLREGETGLSVAFDYPTIRGYDSDHPMSLGEVGTCGVAVSSLRDMELLFEGIPLDRVSTSMTINGPAAMLLAMYIAVGDEQGVPGETLRGTTQNDMLKEFFAQKLCIFPPEPSVRLVTDIIEYCTDRLPMWNPISISGYHIREAGANALQELAFTLADGIAYVEAALERGLDVDEFAPRLSFFFASHSNLLEEVAKFRAARRLWARIMRDRFRAEDERSMWMRMHVQTSGCALTAQQPINNIVRVTLQALAAVLGGTQSLHTNSFDEALALPSERAVMVSLRTQQIIAHESGAADTVDPLAGSYCLEALTDEMEEGAMEYIDRIDGMGGVIPAIEEGFFQREIADASYRYQREVDSGERIVVGVNEHRVEEDWLPTELLKVEKTAERDQVARLRRLKADRDRKKVKGALDKLHDDADRGGNLMPTIIEAVKAYATLGEMCDVLREAFGEYRELIVF